MAERKVALVTGGAKRVGAAIVRALAAEGYSVLIHCNASVGEAEGVAREVEGLGRRAAVVPADLANPDAVAKLMAEAAKPFGPPTLLVNSASLFIADTLTTLDVPTWNRQFSVNIRAPSVLAGDFARMLPSDEQGSIVNILDQRVRKLTPQFYSYTLSKAAMFAATTTMAQALAPRVRVNAVGPGPVLPNEHDGAELFLKEAEGTPLGRSVPPEDIAAAVVYLASARSVTGQMIAVDAGQSVGWRTPDIVG